MTFVNPNAMIWGLLAVPIVILYLRRIRPPRHSVATGPLWGKIYPAEQSDSVWWWLRHVLSLGTQLLILALLVLALAEPHFRPPRRVVLVVDASASMSATDLKPTRLEQARRLGLNWINELAYRDQMAIISAGDRLRVKCGLTSRHTPLQEALQTVRATYGPTRVGEAVEIGRRLLAGNPNGKIVVLTDGCFEGAVQLARQDDVQLILVGSSGDNVGVTGLKARRTPTDPLQCQIFAEVTSFTDEPVECQLAIALEGKLIRQLPIEFAEAGRWQEVFEMTTPAGGELTASLNRPDVFPTDDFASAAIPSCRIHPLILVTEGSQYLEQVLRANSLVELTVTDTPPAEVAEGTVRVFDRQVPATLPDGPLLVVDPAGGCDLWQSGDVLEEPVVAGQADGSPVLADVRLEGVHLPQARRLVLSDEIRLLAQPLAWTADGSPVGYTIDRPSGRVLVLTGILAGGDLPGRTAFPILMANAVRWLAASDGQPPDSVPEEGLAGELPDVSESDIRVPAELALNAEVPAAGKAGPALWVFLAAAAMGLLVIEWSLFQRRWIC